MKNTRKEGKTVSVEQVACMAERGNDVSRFFSNTGRMMRPINACNVDFASPMSQQPNKALIKRLKRD